MFSFGRILKGCSGCQLLWSDPNKQAGAYDAVDKDDKEEKDDPDLEPLSPSDIVFSQPGGRRTSWSLDMESPIVKNQSPIVKNASKSASLERKQSFTGQNSPIVKTRTPPRDAFTISNSSIVKNRTPPRNTFMGDNSPIVKSKTPPRNAFRMSASNDQISELAVSKSKSPQRKQFKASVSNNDISDIDKAYNMESSSSPNLSSNNAASEYRPTVHSSKTSKKNKKANSELALQVVSVV